MRRHGSSLTRDGRAAIERRRDQDVPSMRRACPGRGTRLSILRPSLRRGASRQKRADRRQRAGGNHPGASWLPVCGARALRRTGLGIIAATRSALHPRKHGPWIIAVATLAFLGWGAVIYAEVHSSEHHAAVQAEEKVERSRQEQASQQATERSEALTKEQEASEKQYCAEHPHAGEHMAGGYHYYECTAASEEP